MTEFGNVLQIKETAAKLSFYNCQPPYSNPNRTRAVKEDSRRNLISGKFNIECAAKQM